jgi:hypothetical protein
MASATAPMTDRHRLLVFGGLMLAALMSSLDATVLGTALPTIVGDLGGLDRLAWVSTAYVLATSVTVPLSGRLGDLFGRRRVLLVGLLGFLAGSAACGAAPGMTWLIVFRAVQGAAAGCLMSSMFALTGELFEPRERARYQAYSALVLAVSSIAGPLAGGVLTEGRDAVRMGLARRPRAGGGVGRAAHRVGAGRARRRRAGRPAAPVPRPLVQRGLRRRGRRRRHGVRVTPSAPRSWRPSRHRCATASPRPSRTRSPPCSSPRCPPQRWAWPRRCCSATSPWRGAARSANRERRPGR